MARIKTAEQYAERYEKRGDVQRRRQAKAYIHGVVASGVRRTADGMPANHAARFVSLNEYYGSLFKGRKMPDFTKIPLEGGSFKGCAHSLSVWYEDTDDKGRTIYFQRAAPCTIDHGFTVNKHGHPCVSMGKPGEHLDSHGRKW